MDGHEQPLSDDALDREIAAVLAVDPSPEYVARIRERLALETTHPAFAWPLLPACAAAATIAVVVMATAGAWMRGSAGPAPEQRAAVGATPGRSIEVTPPPVPVPVTPNAAALEPALEGVTAAGRRNRVVATGVRARTAEVQITKDDAIALRQMVEAINARRLDSSAVPVLGSPSSPLPELEAIVVDQIALSPLVALDAQ